MEVILFQTEGVVTPSPEGDPADRDAGLGWAS